RRVESLLACVPAVLIAYLLTTLYPRVVEPRASEPLPRELYLMCGVLSIARVKLGRAECDDLARGPHGEKAICPSATRAILAEVEIQPPIVVVVGKYDLPRSCPKPQVLAVAGEELGQVRL